MKRNIKGLVLIILFAMLTVFLSGCGSIQQMINPPTATPYPTVTPYPTFTAYPTYTPLPPEGAGISQTWKVTIESVERTSEYKDWMFTEDSGGEFILVMVNVTNLTSKAQVFYPKAALLLYTNNQSYPGEAVMVATFEKQDGDYYNFNAVVPIEVTVYENQTGHYVFAFEIVATNHHDFAFLFPGVPAIPITIK